MFYVTVIWKDHEEPQGRYKTLEEAEKRAAGLKKRYGDTFQVKIEAKGSSKKKEEQPCDQKKPLNA